MLPSALVCAAQLGNPPCRQAQPPRHLPRPLPGRQGGNDAPVPLSHLAEPLTEVQAEGGNICNTQPLVGHRDLLQVSAVLSRQSWLTSRRRRRRVEGESTSCAASCRPPTC